MQEALEIKNSSINLQNCSTDAHCWRSDIRQERVHQCCYFGASNTKSVLVTCRNHFKTSLRLRKSEQIPHKFLDAVMMTARGCAAGCSSLASTEEDTKCRLCNSRPSHTLHHYIVQCDHLKQFRNSTITDVTQQIEWMFKHDKVDELMKFKKAKCIIWAPMYIYLWVICVSFLFQCFILCLQILFHMLISF